ncbi:hypothetical protein BABINDRAFT_160458 [Babjeviella inositovora NRRL Y-12698]|uniref:Uncharacterized protein n=1 Tax=Babjeviella inositovora NRRL Y-12698 TaxID=984486 RepID=A0A1E3QTN1_9ASCO|nr:uncharacterized protein BABINDRAFT_160458 [Babjeviella inositovora NRRL Y-12698]ODQ81041.1 hypothetical protein BABINDRAFT_160458 [Babjeviella inositovora NRRL Y-12698]
MEGISIVNSNAGPSLDITTAPFMHFQVRCVRDIVKYRLIVANYITAAQSTH